MLYLIYNPDELIQTTMRTLFILAKIKKYSNQVQVKMLNKVKSFIAFLNYISPRETLAYVQSGYRYPDAYGSTESYSKKHMWKPPKCPSTVEVDLTNNTEKNN